MGMISTSSRVRREAKVKVCGNQLVNMLKIICSYRGSSSKRETKPKKLKKNKTKNKKKKDRKGRKHDRSENLTVRKEKKMRRKKGVVDKCCVSSCTIRQLYRAC